MNFFYGLHINRILIGFLQTSLAGLMHFRWVAPQFRLINKFFRNTRRCWRRVILQNSLSRRPSTVWLWWFRNDYILLDIDSIELLILLDFAKIKLCGKPFHYNHDLCMFFMLSTYTSFVIFITMFMKKQVHCMEHTCCFWDCPCYKYECNQVVEVGNHTKQLSETPSSETPQLAITEIYM